MKTEKLHGQPDSRQYKEIAEVFHIYVKMKLLVLLELLPPRPDPGSEV